MDPHSSRDPGGSQNRQRARRPTKSKGYIVARWGAYEVLRDERGRGQVYVGLGKTAVRRGETTQAIAMWSAASELFRNLGYEEQVRQLQGALRHIWSGGEVRVA